MDGAPAIGQQLSDEVEYRPTDEGPGRDGLIFDAHKVKVDTHYRTHCPYMYE